MKLTTDSGVKEWVASKLPIVRDWGPSECIGVFRNDQLIAGVVYNNYRRGWDIEMSIASTSPKWATKQVIGVLLAYPFEQLGVHRVTATTESSNHHARQFLEKIGFKHEGTIREAFPEDDAAIYGLLKSEYTKSKWYGKEKRA